MKPGADNAGFRKVKPRKRKRPPSIEADTDPRGAPEADAVDLDQLHRHGAAGRNQDGTWRYGSSEEALQTFFGPPQRTGTTADGRPVYCAEARPLVRAAAARRLSRHRPILHLEAHQGARARSSHGRPVRHRGSRRTAGVRAGPDDDEAHALSPRAAELAQELQEASDGLIRSWRAERLTNHGEQLRVEEWS